MKTETKILTARAAFATTDALAPLTAEQTESDVQFMPPGPQDIVCWVNGQPRRLQFTVTAKHAELFNAQLQTLLAKARDGKGDKPLTDYNHEDGAASGRPLKITWGGEDLKTGGIRLTNKWTGKAKSSIRDEEFDRFSPQWDFDEKTGEPIAIGVNLGGLVNKAAFKSIATVQAKSAAETLAAAQAAASSANPPDKSGTTESKQMTEQEIATAVAKGAEAANKTLVETITKLSEQFTELEKKQTAQAKDASTAQAKACVAKHVARGAIAPQDTKAIAFWEAAHVANAADAEEQLNKINVISRGRVIPNTHSTATGSAVDPEGRILEKAKELRKANTAFASDAAALDAYLRTPEGNAAYAESLLERSDKRKDVATAR